MSVFQNENIINKATGRYLNLSKNDNDSKPNSLGEVNLDREQNHGGDTQQWTLLGNKTLKNKATALFQTTIFNRDTNAERCIEYNSGAKEATWWKCGDGTDGGWKKWNIINKENGFQLTTDDNVAMCLYDDGSAKFSSCGRTDQKDVWILGSTKKKCDDFGIPLSECSEMRLNNNSQNNELCNKYEKYGSSSNCPSRQQNIQKCKDAGLSWNCDVSEADKILKCKSLNIINCSLDNINSVQKKCSDYGHTGKVGTAGEILPNVKPCNVESVDETEQECKKLGINLNSCSLEEIERVVQKNATDSILNAAKSAVVVPVVDVGIPVAVPAQSTSDVSVKPTDIKSSITLNKSEIQEYISPDKPITIKNDNFLIFGAVVSLVSFSSIVSLSALVLLKR